MQLKTDIKFEQFFDRAKVLNEVHKDNLRRLSRAAAFIRRRARSSLKRRKKTSAPGKPPSVHSRDEHATLKKILFGLDSDGESVVIGPVALASSRLKGSSASTVAELLEFGGTATVKRKRATYATRSFMGPALEAEVSSGSMADLWKSRG